jgi:hypothetical protein
MRRRSGEDAAGVGKSWIEFDRLLGAIDRLGEAPACKCDQALAVCQITIRKSRGLSRIACSRAASERSGSPPKLYAAPK